MTLHYGNKNIDAPVINYMTNSVTCLYPNDSVREALELMVEDDHRAFPVVDFHDKCLGIFSATDMLNKEHEEETYYSLYAKFDGNWSHALGQIKDNHLNLKVEDVMTQPVFTISRSASIIKAAQMMDANHVHRLVIVDDKESVVGIISTMDIVRAVGELTN